MAVAIREVLDRKETTQASNLPNKCLINEQAWEKLVGYMVKEKDMERSLAERIMDPGTWLSQADLRYPWSHLLPVQNGGHWLACLPHAHTRLYCVLQ